MKHVVRGNRSRLSWLVLAGLIAAAGTAQAGDECDAANGEKVFGKCAVCHAIAVGAPHGAGPNLHAVVGRPVGKIEGFKFSKGMRTSEETWTPGHLDAFLENPMGVYARTRMAFGGLKNEQDRRDVLCYLQQAGGEP